MKNYKKGCLTLAIIAMMPLVMANTVQDERIFVTTFNDENGENLGACSLREAIKAAEINQPYGGCSAGKVRPSLIDTIVLKKGEYQLTRSLYPASQLIIQGADGKDWSKKDPITGTYPASALPASSIRGNKTFSLLDTSAGQGSLSLNDLILTDGGGELGGAIHGGTPIQLNNVYIKDSVSTQKGGAIYLSGSKSSLNVQKSIFDHNQAPQGAVLAMTCLDNLKFTERSIKIGASSILNNGGNTTKSVIELCGKPEIEFVNNTITRNMASSSGSIIKFTGDSRPNTTDSSILSASATLSLQQNTIIDNSAYSTFLYDSIGNKSFIYNIIGYNKQGYSCRHLLGNLNDDDKKNIAFGLASNALNKHSAATDYCDVPYQITTTSDTDTTIDLSKLKQDDVLLPLQTKNQLSPLPVYFLKTTANHPFVNKGLLHSCQATDQLGRSRSVENSILSDEQNTCDIGSIEKSELSVIDMTNQNKSLVDLIKAFEIERDFFKNLLDDRNTQAEFLPYYKIRYQEEADKVESYPKTFKYRVSYFDIFSLARPQEVVNASGAAELQHFSKELYTVTTEPLGTGPDVLANKMVNSLPSVKDPNLKCEWNESIQRVLMYRIDGLMNQAGDYDYCKYTIILKADPSVKATGLLQANFINIMPIAVNDTYTLKWGTDQRVRLDLLANDHDNGDGKPTDPFYPKDKKAFYTDPSGISAPIKIGKIDGNLHFEAEYQLPCPDESGAMCYGGDMYVQPKNSFNKFNYSFTYSVFDADGGMSNTATVELINTATTTDDTRGPNETPKYNTGKSSGGSAGIWTIFGLLGLVILRRKYMK